MVRIRASRQTLLVAVGVVTPVGVLLVNFSAFVMVHLAQFRVLIAACALISSLLLNGLAASWLIARRRSSRAYRDFPELVRAAAAIAVVGSAALAAYFTYLGLRDARTLPNLVAIIASLLALAVPVGLAFLGRLMATGSGP